MTKILRAALNFSKLSVPSKISKARMIANAILSNPATFVTPVPDIATIQSAVDELEIAREDAEDGGKMKTALMHDKEVIVTRLLTQLATYVESVANNNEAVIHLAGMETKKDATRHVEDFTVEHADDRGGVFLRVKPHKKSAYKWEYCKDPIDQNAWVVAKTTVQYTTAIGGLIIGAKYWFRVTYLSNLGETIPFEPVSIIVI